MSLLTLWAPILAGAVLVFGASSVIHMFLRYHAGDFSRLPDEERFREAVGAMEVPPGDYIVPHAGSHEAMRSEEWRNKVLEGPNVFLTVMPKAQMHMGLALALWFAYCVLVGVFTAYVAAITLPAGSEYLTVFRVTGTVAFCGYGLALLQDSIWYSKRWSATARNLFDGLVYALLTAGCFGWLWPAG